MFGIEDDVLGRKADADQQVVGAAADLDLTRLGIRLSGLIERHHHGGGAIAHALARDRQERILALLHADRVDDRLAADAFQPRLDHAPFGAVDHYRHPRDVGLGGDQLQERRHRVLGVEQAFVHVDVDDLRAVLDLRARDLDGLRIIARHDELLERRRPGDVGALADIDEGGGSGGHWYLLRPLPQSGRGTASRQRSRVRGGRGTRPLRGRPSPWRLRAFPSPAQRERVEITPPSSSAPAQPAAF